MLENDSKSVSIVLVNDLLLNFKFILNDEYKN
jgi:hypothetical protein